MSIMKSIGVLILVAGVSGAWHANACSNWDHDWVYPGAMCRYYGRYVDDTFFTTAGVNSTGLKNNSASTASVTCPFVSPVPYGSVGVYLAEISVSGTGYSATACSVHVTSWNGATTWVAPTPTLNVNGGNSDFLVSNWGC